MAALVDGYVGWIRRAECFVRSLHSLPGQWGVEIAIGPPIPSAEADQLARQLPLGLPDPLRLFYTTAASNFCCRYTWDPNVAALSELESVFPHQYSFYGGPRFLPWNELLEAHGMHTWWDDLPCEWTAAQIKAHDDWRHTIPFIAVGNGDAIGLLIREGTSSMPVVYLCHDDEDHPVTPISSSFDQFLADWELLRYIGPEIWMLSPFLGDEYAGPLSAACPSALRWQELIVRYAARPLV